LTTRPSGFFNVAISLISAGLSERERDLVYNTQVLVGPGGYIGKQRKLHLSRDEVLFYAGGRDLPVFDEADHRLVEHVGGDAEQEDGVGERGEDLQPVEPEGPLRVGARGRGGVDGGPE